MIELYKDVHGHLIEVHEQSDDVIRFARQGGGLLQAMPRDKFDEIFTPVPDGEPVVWKCVKVTIEGLPGTYPAYSNNRRWNGWVMPYFTKEAADRIMAETACIGTTQGYNELVDAFEVNFGSDPVELETHGATVIYVDGVPMKVYGVGAGSWCWEEAEGEANVKPE